MITHGFFHRNTQSLIAEIAALVLVAGVVGATPAQLQLQYTFEPNGCPPDTLTAINDRSGNGHTGNAITPSEATFVPGPSGNMNAIHFDADDNDVSTVGSGVSTGIDTFSLGITGNDFTVMAWVNRDTYKGDNMVFGTGSDNNTDNGTLHLGFRTTGVRMGFWNNDSMTSTGIAKGEWHHLAWRYTVVGGKQDIFIDGVLINSEPNHQPYASGRILLVGRTSYNLGAFEGSISDARVYNLVLADADIATIAASPP